MKREMGAGRLFCWLSGILTTSICLGILIYIAVRGAPALNWDFISKSPEMSLLGDGLAGGILSPLLGTLGLVTLGMMLALPWAVAMAVYYAEYAGDNWLANILRIGNDVLAGVPTIVIALFGLVIFSYPELSFLSIKIEGVENGKAFGRSYLVASITMAVMVLPYVTKSVEEAIIAVSHTYREAACALGVSKWRTIQKVVLPAAYRGIVSGAVLGVGRIASDVAIVWFCLGATITYSGPENWWQPQNWAATLRSAGNTLSSYIYYASPVGEGNNADRAYGAALVLILMILLLNGVANYVSRLSRIKSRLFNARGVECDGENIIEDIPSRI